ncbi:vanin-like protein 3 isoform X1 [Sitophilus oryzae]|uniref:Vanin-like protein 3 isoform X1 n=1 Tax=Sitophilus oryzae TaxID=7048 RepID=A0A6J2YID0_SITOR|nr:vanin-like protein 3 isoform X1 [Sitophilus oryzae]
MYSTKFSITCIFIFNVFCNIQFIFAQDSTYTVTVVEYGPNLNYSLSPEERLEFNTRNYVDIIAKATENKDMDLIIFPESTLTYLNSYATTAATLPPLYDVVLCNYSEDSYSKFLEEFSCAAIKYNVTIVINLTEKDKCDTSTNCDETDHIFYNTNVVFGTNGSLLARYRKFNLFGEYGKSKPAYPDISIFKIRNSSFGLMTCFDIQFTTPAFNLTRQHQVENIIFPLNWISELPFLTALQTEQMWAQELDVVLLASGSSNPSRGAGGSGIFLGKNGPLEQVILSNSSTKILSHQVSKDAISTNISLVEGTNDTDVDNIAKTLDDFFMLVDPTIAEHNFKVLNTNENSVTETVCHGDEINVLCCNFNVSVTVNEKIENNNDYDSYTYLLVAFSGVRTFSGFYYGGIEQCGVVACLNETVSSCGRRFSNYSNVIWPLTINSINITGNFSSSENKIQFPTTLLSSIYPLPVSHYTWDYETRDSQIIKRLELNKPQSRLLAFGIYGRDFSRDWDPLRNNTGNDGSGSNVVKGSLISLFLLVVVSLIL